MNSMSSNSLSSLAKSSNNVPVTTTTTVTQPLTQPLLGKGHKMEQVKSGYVKQGDCFIEADVYQKKTCPEPTVCGQPVVHHHHKYSNWVSYLFWFVIIAVIVWFILFALKPDFVQQRDEDDNTTGEVDHGRVLLTALLIALAVCFVIWIFKWSCGGKHVMHGY